MLRFALGMTGAILCATLARGQCPPQWLPGPAMPGTDGPVRAATVWDADGPGPQPARLVIAGEFSVAGSAVASKIAIWDGSVWKGLGPGANGYIHALSVYQSQLIAAGTFTTIGGVSATNIARLSGSTWQPLGEGMGGTFYNSLGWEFPSHVRALAVHNGRLFAGGMFSSAGGTPALHVAQWDGAAWQALGDGMGGYFPNSKYGKDVADPYVTALGSYNGELIAAGRFTSAGGVGTKYIARWNGTAWQPLGGGLYVSGGYPHVASLVVYNGQLVAGGAFTAAGGAQHIARWNGSTWQPLGGGIGPGPHTSYPYVAALAVHNGQLIMGGSFTAGGAERQIARWNGTSWAHPGTDVDGNVCALVVFAGKLIAAGDFKSVAGTPAMHIARLDGGAWRPLEPQTGLGGSATLAVYNGDLVAGGGFLTAGGKLAKYIARWDGAAWFPMGNANWSVAALRPYQSSLIAGGLFTKAGGVLASRVARWDGAAWHPLGAGISNGGAPGPTPAVLALGEYDGRLIAGGRFKSAGGVGAQGIASWDGGAWQPLGAGMSGGYGSGTRVDAVTLYGGGLIAGGSFTAAGGAPANSIARWDGASWHALGGGLTGGTDPHVRALEVHQGSLIVGGSFALAGGAPAKHIARWDGVAWHPMAAGMTGSSVNALAVHHGSLYAGGTFSHASGVSARGIARWNGSAWEALGFGVGVGSLDRSVNALVVRDSELIASGPFRAAGGKVSVHTARWGCTCYADCNADGQATPADLGCFQALLAASHPYTDCNSDGLFDLADLQCFQAKLAAGCP